MQPRIRPDAPAARLVIRTKCDLVPEADKGSVDLSVSARTGAGLASLRALVRQRLEGLARPSETAISTALRCQESLTAAGAALRQAEALAAEHGEEELLAVELRLALQALGEVVGAVYREDLLDRLFSRFCIGK